MPGSRETFYLLLFIHIIHYCGIIRSCVCEEKLSPCRWCWLQMPPWGLGFFLQINLLILQGSQSWENPWWNVTDTGTQSQDTSQISNLCSAGFVLSSGGDNQTRSTFHSCGRWSQLLPSQGDLSPKAICALIEFQLQWKDKVTFLCLFSGSFAHLLFLNSELETPMAILCNFKQIIYLLLSGASY